MIRTKDEIMAAITARLGEDTSDEALAFLEDMTDTLSDYEARTADTTDWKSKYEENDASWRKRYAERFSGNPTPNGGSGVDTIQVTTEEVIADPEPDEPKTYEQLYPELYN